MKYRAYTGFLVIVLIAVPLQAMIVEKEDPWKGKEYSRNSHVQLAAGKFLLDNIELCGNETVLDLGCGTCDLAALIAQKLPHGKVIAVDVSDNMLKEAEDKYGRIPNLKMYHQDITGLTLGDDDKADVVISVMTLHWIENLELMYETFQNLACSLKPSAKFYAVFNVHDTKPYPNIPREIALKVIGLDEWKQYFIDDSTLGNDLTIEDYQTLLENWFDGKVEVTPFPDIKLTRQQLVSVLSVIPFAQAVPEDRRPEFLRQILEQLEDKFNEDGLFVVTPAYGTIKATLK